MGERGGSGCVLGDPVEEVDVSMLSTDVRSDVGQESTGKDSQEASPEDQSEFWKAASEFEEEIGNTFLQLVHRVQARHFGFGSLFVARCVRSRLLMCLFRSFKQCSCGDISQERVSQCTGEQHIVDVPVEEFIDVVF